MDPELKQYLDDIKREMQTMKRELLDHTEAVETRLLAEFWKWARTADARYRQSHAVVGALDDRVQAVEDRVADLERRKAS
jgi:polyhydroxyalkanoate synthesis regulator phasin